MENVFVVCAFTRVGGTRIQAGNPLGVFTTEAAAEAGKELLNQRRPNQEFMVKPMPLNPVL